MFVSQSSDDFCYYTQPHKPARIYAWIRQYARLRYYLGGDLPSQTTQYSLSTLSFKTYYLSFPFLFR